MRRCLVLALALMACGAGPAPARGLPPGFFGVVSQAPLGGRDFDRMHGVVGTLRLPVYWADCEPQPGRYGFAALDAIVGEAAQDGVRVLPFVYGSPGWLRPDPARPPLGSARARAAWAGFLRVLVDRYGPHGSFWRGRAALPIRSWQIWNEPNFLLFWRPRPSPRGYARLLGLSARAIHGRDPRARIVAAGLAPVGAGIPTWEFLRQMYRVRGVRAAVDAIALHPYSSTLAGMAAQIRDVRTVMSQAGDGREPLLISELGVASWGSFPSSFVLGPDGQARFVRDALGLLVRERRRWHIAGVDWFAWQDAPAADPHCSFCEGAGLFAAGGRPKPAWLAFRRAVAAARSGPERRPIG
ncbi:MAG TPA: hypothetical protein VHA54_11535 [Solirubrobacterales bacterium]|nr:hypothetical protein [Solirubrobacterales bacterium]